MSRIDRAWLAWLAASIVVVLGSTFAMGLAGVPPFEAVLTAWLLALAWAWGTPGVIRWLDRLMYPRKDGW